MIDPSRCLLGSILLSVSLAAQVPERPEFGPFSSTGLGFVRQGPGNDLMEYRADQVGAQPFLQIGQSGPVFTRAAIFHQLAGQPSLLAQVAIDAMSTGNDLIPGILVSVSPGVSAFRITQLGPLGWSALFFSFRNGSLSPTSPEPMLRRFTNGGAGADLYSWITPGSNVLGGFESAMFLDVASQRLGIPQSGEIAAMDIGMALMAQAKQSYVPVFAPHADDFYFSLTKASAAALTNQIPGIPSIHMSGATVFHVRWIAGAWSDIDVVVTPEELALAQSTATNTDQDPTNDEELDALAVDAQVSPPRVIFSVQASPANLPQLQYYRSGAGAGTGRGEVQDETGNGIQVYTGGADIDAICGIDPETILLLSPYLGTPFSYTPDPPFILSATHMVSTTSGAMTVVVDVNGPPPHGSKLDIQEAAGTLAVFYNVVGTAQWVLWGNLVPWSGRGSVRSVLPVTVPVPGPIQFQAAFIDAAGGLQVSSVVLTTM